MALVQLVLRNLWRHPMRSLLTIGSFVVAVFLLCVMRSVVETLEVMSDMASARRLWVQSAVSLYVELPIHYPEKIARVEGVERVCKWQWFGGYYQDPMNFFGQFAVDEKELLGMYPEIDIVAGSQEAFRSNRIGCLVGNGIAKEFDWKVGDRIPIIGALFPHPEGADVAWEFEIEGIYQAKVRNFDNRTLYFHWDYFEKTLEDSRPVGVSVIGLLIEDGTDPTGVMAEVDQLFENGPQRVQTTTESEFNAQFASMWGNLPFLLTTLGGGVLVAILVGCLNTMLMTSRDQTVDVGIMKALGFTNGSIFTVSLAQALALSTAGGLAGLALTLAIESWLAGFVGMFLPGFLISTESLAFGMALSILVGLLAGFLPAWQSSRLHCVEALGSAG